MIIANRNNDLKGLHFGSFPVSGVVRILAGSVLLVAGILKLHQFFFLSPTIGLISDTFGQNAHFVLAIFEILLGLASISNPRSTSIWLATTTCFFGFAAINLVFVAVGQTECECFGVLRSRPVLSLAIDLIALIGLVACKPISFDRRTKHFLVEYVEWQKLTVLAVCAVIILFVQFTTVGRMVIARAAGTPLIAESRVSFMGQQDGGSRGQAEVKILNASTNSVTIIGYRGNCRNSIVTQLPQVVPPRSATVVEFVARIGTNPGFGSGQIELFTDADNFPILQIPYVYMSKGRVNQ